MQALGGLLCMERVEGKGKRKKKKNNLPPKAHLKAACRAESSRKFPSSREEHNVNGLVGHLFLKDDSVASSGMFPATTQAWVSFLESGVL